MHMPPTACSRLRTRRTRKAGADGAAVDDLHEGAQRCDAVAGSLCGPQVHCVACAGVARHMCAICQRVVAVQRLQSTLSVRFRPKLSVKFRPIRLGAASSPGPPIATLLSYGEEGLTSAHCSTPEPLEPMTERASAPSSQTLQQGTHWSLAL